MVHQRVDQRARRGARRRMDHHAGGLVDHDQVGVLIGDASGIASGRASSGGGLADLDMSSPGSARALPSRTGPRRAGDRALGDQPGQARARQRRLLWRGQGARKRLIKVPVALPAGATARAITFGEGWIAVVTDGDRILIFAPDGRLVQDVAVAPVTP
jgi:hypothetical protein